MSRFVLFAWLFVAACYPPIEETCADVAQSQCNLCLECGVDLSRACGLATGDDCLDTLTQRCENQASTLEDPKSEVQSCADAISTWGCADVLQATAQDRPATIDECSYFL